MVLKSVKVQESVIPSSEWTPLWSDVFKDAEQKSEETKLIEWEEKEKDRFYQNLALCEARNIKHVQPMRNFCPKALLLYSFEIKDDRTCTFRKSAIKSL